MRLKDLLLEIGEGTIETYNFKKEKSEDLSEGKNNVLFVYSFVSDDNTRYLVLIVVRVH